MCGIAGFWNEGLRQDDAETALTRMTDAIRHRGPDDAGQWFDPAAGIALGHRRLSIVELSALGHQPMPSASGRYVMVFNGEIYNFRELRHIEEQHGARFRGSSDTEVLLALIERVGLSAALKQCVGMFAIAVWDTHDRVLQLARDRFGEKPLYFARIDGGLAFASELSPIRRAPGFSGTLDRAAISDFLRHRYINAPRTIFNEVRKLEPATIATFAHRTAAPTFETYWSLQDVVYNGGEQSIARGRSSSAVGENELVDELDARLRAGIADQMLADVPLGAFLSGGIDSSLIVALMQAQSTQPVRTFTIGFREAGFDESPHAEAVARHLGTSHTTMYVGAKDALDLIPHLPSVYDEPFADSSQIPTVLVAALARQHVTVALSGDGGDELFGGYSRYAQTIALWNRIRRMPAGVRRAAAGAVTSIGIDHWDTALQPLGMIARGYNGDRLHTMARLFGANDASTLYSHLLSSWRNPSALVRGSHNGPVAVDAFPMSSGHPNGLLAHMMLHDQQTYLPGDIMVKVDRAAMAASLETRAPLLDHRVAEFAWSLQYDQWMRGGKGKWILRSLLDRYVPRALVDRPKHGFGIPYGEWLRGPLREWAEDLLSPAALEADELFDSAPIVRRWKQHVSGANNWAPSLWSVLMLQAWRRHTP